MYNCPRSTLDSIQLCDLLKNFARSTPHTAFKTRRSMYALQHHYRVNLHHRRQQGCFLGFLAYIPLINPLRLHVFDDIISTICQQIAVLSNTHHF